jgi:hypothetical protein
MTKPFDEQYVKDRDAAARLNSRNYPRRSGHTSSFISGSDWCKQYFDAKVAELEETIKARNLRINEVNKFLHDASQLNAILEKRIEGLREALNNITICSSRDSASYDASKALKRDDELRGADCKRKLK